MNATPLLRLQWAAAVAADPIVGDRAKAVAAVFAFVLNKDTGASFVSMATLGRLAGKCERSTRLAVRELEDAGWLLCKRTKGRLSNVYKPDFERSSNYDPFPATRQDDAGLTRQERAGMDHINPASDGIQPGILVPPTRQDHAPYQGNKVNKAFGSAPLGAHAEAERKRRPTPGMNRARAEDFARIMASRLQEKPTEAGDTAAKQESHQ